MVAYYESENSGSGVVPTDGQAPVHETPLPEGHEPQTPEILQDLAQELDEIRLERGKLMAKRYPGTTPAMSETTRPKYLEMKALDKAEEELDKKEQGLRQRINELMPLNNEKPDATS